MRNCLEQLETMTKATQKKDERANCKKDERTYYKKEARTHRRKNLVKIEPLNLSITLQRLNNNFLFFLIRMIFHFIDIILIWRDKHFGILREKNKMFLFPFH